MKCWEFAHLKGVSETSRGWTGSPGKEVFAITIARCVVWNRFGCEEAGLAALVADVWAGGYRGGPCWVEAQRGRK